MVFREDQIRNIADRAIEALKPIVSINAVYLFGSYSTGRATDLSDIDLAFVSDQFSGMPDYERSKLLMRVLDRIDIPEPKDIEPVGLTNNEFENPEKFSLASQIRQTGKEIIKLH